MVLRRRILVFMEWLSIKMRELSVRAGLRLIHLKYLQKWVLLGTVIGVAGGLGAIVFYYLLEACSHFFFVDILNNGPRWIIFFIPALGGLIVGPLIYQFAPEAEGHGTDAVIAAFHRHWGNIRTRVPIIKTLASSITIGSGGSAGREGPIAQIGAGFGSLLAKLLNLEVSDRKVVVIAGVSAGIGSIFRAPLGGALFGIEVPYRRDFEIEALIPATISAVVGYSIFSLFRGWGTIFETPRYIFTNPLELILFAILGIICGLVAIVYVKVFYGLRDHLFRRIPVSNFFKPAIGGLLTGLVALFLPQVLGMGYDIIQISLYGQLAIALMLMLVLGKILATSFTISSGGSGGVFAPSLFIGAMLGGALGQIFYTLFPTLVPQPTAFVLVGMAAFFAGAAKVPIAAMIMVCEMSGSYSLLLPLMLTCVIAYILTGDITIYENQQDRRLTTS